MINTIEKKYRITITKRQANKAFPALWWWNQSGKEFTVKDHKDYEGVFEVLHGQFKGKAIGKTDCTILYEK